MLLREESACWSWTCCPLGMWPVCNDSSCCAIQNKMSSRHFAVVKMCSRYLLQGLSWASFFTISAQWDWHLPVPWHWRVSDSWMWVTNPGFGWLALTLSGKWCIAQVVTLAYHSTKHGNSIEPLCHSSVSCKRAWQQLISCWVHNLGYDFCDSSQCKWFSSCLTSLVLILLLALVCMRTNDRLSRMLTISNKETTLCMGGVLSIVPPVTVL